MTNLRSWREIPAARMLVAGAASGALVLGVGGRLAMAAIQEASNTTRSNWTLGGTMTVVFLGVASGLGGAVMAFVSRWLAGRLPVAWLPTQYLLLAGMLYYITMRGLHGTAPVGRLYFIPLVAVYAFAMIWSDKKLSPTQADG